MKKLITNNLNGKKVLLLFVLCNTVYATMLIITIPELMQFSGELKILDMMPMGYNVQYVHSLFDALGTSGREAYLCHQLPLDLIYPGLFGISSCLVLAYFLNKLNKLDSWLFYCCLLPLFSGLFDYGENIGIITMLKGYPTISSLQIQITSVFTVLKSIFTSIYFIILIITLLAVAKKKIFPKK
jgi:hypothetical protein